VLFAAGAISGAVYLKPISGVEPGEVAFRTNRLTGRIDEVREGWVLDIPGIHRIRRYSLREQIYRPEQSATIGGSNPFQSIEGLTLGVAFTVRYAFDLDHLRATFKTLPDDIGQSLVEPTTDGVLHRVIATHTVREIFSSQRDAIQKEVADSLRPLLATDGVVLLSVFIGNVDLPQDYRHGLESMLSEELAVEKMHATLDMKEKEVKEAELTGEADKVRRQKAAEAAGDEQVIAAKAQAEAMQHIIPFKEKEIEQRRLEAEAEKVARLKQAEGEADARRIESSGEADSRRKLADAEAYRVEVTGKATSEQMARDAQIITANPLLIQKALADKLSDKVSVVIAPPQAGGFFAANLLGGGTAAKAAPTADAKPRSNEDGDKDDETAGRTE
jgi:regulator of protease activity HflC (stomatin/prohibitin superfamily)